MEIRQADGSHRNEILKLIAWGNAQQETRCLHCSDTEDEILGDMREINKDVDDLFWVGTVNDQVVATVGLDIDEDKGKAWLWGPYSLASDADQLTKITTAALQAVTEGCQVANFLDKRNSVVAGVMRKLGLVSDACISVLNLRLDQLANTEGHMESDADPSAIKELHNSLFPGNWRSAEEMLAGVESRSRLITYHEAEALVGYAFVVDHSIASEATLEYIGVAPRYRNHGIAKRMILEAARHARNQWQDKILKLTVNEENPAIHLYKSMGFVVAYEGVGFKRLGL